MPTDFSSAVPFEVVSSRLLPFPREQVYEAFRDSQQLVLWWGPKGFSNTIYEFDLRPGGAWHITLHGPDGKNYDNVKEFTEVVHGERVVFRHVQSGHDFTMAMTYETRDGGTLLTWRLMFDEAGSEQMRAFIAKANEENFDRLEGHLKTERAA